ncbi:SDR family NAD(P)-dependent oxidoreductase [Opitutus terrae]|uniref:Short-chain dehydrogenase/reductase SDR n=1 Tax=Opitutus terrae (strain DSM 11246 / JCM 15787 / PB90-1) TaxID=452637 RepID=B1ZX93_OPITP|nr:SDR family oxidoreductase [Opitutus terrae]ACB76145.1 short-chain dehydrogenase/reductase SDR [Opitutus terrae PB90-1]
MKPTHTRPEMTLITGASSGIGLALAREFARHGHPLAIVAPVEPELHEIAAKLTAEFGVTVLPIAKDLAQETAADEIFDALINAGVSIEILVNNAGLGQRGNFWETPLDRDIEILRVNIEAALRLTKRFLSPMIERKRGRILNTASIAGFEPGPLLAVYHASKAFVLSWSEALATELQDADSGVTLTTLCPGPVDTDFFPKADMVDTKVFQKGNVMSPQEVAETAYEALMKGERVIVPGAMNKAIVAGRRMMPISAQARMNEKMYEEVAPEDRKRERGDIEEKEAARRGE